MWVHVSFVTFHMFDRQTDRQTERHTKYRALRYMQSHGKNDTTEG